MERLILMLHQNNRNKTGLLVSIIICCAFVAISMIIIINKQNIVDQIAVWQYNPSSEVEALVDRAGMNNSGKFLFFASQPKLDSTQDFNTECDRIENVTSILGCYSDSKIYIYNVTDVQLDGIREVTAAHETLHAIYSRLSNEEKSKIDSLIEKEYIKLKVDKDFSDLMAFYDRTEPGQRDNELHSIIGTEVGTVSPELESYYDKYFSNRQSVVSLNAQYSNVFKQLKSRADELAKKLNEYSLSIKANTDSYNTDAAKLSSDIASFNARAASGDFSSQSQFNKERTALINQTSNLESVRTSIKNDVANYELMLTEYNSIASQSKKLYNIIDSTLAPTPSV